MDELERRELQKLEDKKEELSALMKTKHSTRMETLSALVDELPKEHPDLAKFRQDWEKDRAADNAKLQKIERIQEFLMGLDLPAAASSAITPNRARPGIQRYMEVALPPTEEELSTDSDTPLMLKSARRHAPPSVAPRPTQYLQLDSAVTDSSLPPPSPKVASREADRFVDCPVIVRHAQLGWLELQCHLCGGNSQENQGQYLLGIAGLSRHLAHKHSKTATGTRQFGANYVLGKCVRKLTSAEVDAYAKAIEEGRDPIVKRPCSGDDDFTTSYPAFEAEASQLEPPVQKRPPKRHRNSEFMAEGLTGLSRPTLPSKRPRYDTIDSASTLVLRNRMTKARGTRKSTVLQHGIDQGLRIIPTVPPIKTEPDTFIVKLKVPSLFLENYEYDNVQRMQAILPMESKTELLAVLRANNGNFDNAMEQSSQAIEEPASSAPGDTAGSEIHQQASSTVVLGSLSSEEQNSIRRMRRTFPLESVESCLSVLTAYGGNPDQALDHLLERLEWPSATLFTFDAISTPAPALPSALAQAQRSYTPSTPTDFDLGRNAEVERIITIKTVCPCSLSGHRCEVEETCGRTMAQNCRDRSCQNYHEIKSTCPKCLEHDVDLDELAEHRKSCVSGHDCMKKRLAIANKHLCYHH